MDSVRPSSLRRSIILATGALLIGSAIMAGYSWLLIYQPTQAEQLTAVIVITTTIVISFASPLAGFLLWLTLAPFAPFLSFDIHMPAGVPDLGFTRMVGGFLTIYLLAQLARGRQRWLQLTPVEFGLPLFSFALILSAIHASNGWLWGLQSIFDSYLMPLLGYFIARQIITTPSRLRHFATTLLAMGIIIALLVILEQEAGITLFRFQNTSAYYTGDIRKVAGLLGNPAYIAITLAIIVPLALLRLLSDRTLPLRLWAGAQFVLMELGILLTFNRSGWIGGLLAVLAPVFLSRKLAKYAIPLFLAAVLVGVGLLNIMQDSAVSQRLTSESPIDYRLTALQYGLAIHKDAPLLGIGWGSFGREAVRRGFHEGGNIHVLPSTHNTYLNLLVSGGYLLLGSFLFLAVLLFFTLARLHRALRQKTGATPLYILVAWGSFLAYFVPSAAFDNNFAIYANMVFWTLMGAVISVALYDLKKPDLPPKSSLFSTP
ncbi:MAG: hypothetical protein GXP38_15680 [Chloroflexi bacterium]|nr:hypothetical protein [Chloroflexota bacterium]